MELDGDAIVLEVGSGSGPWGRSDVLLDRFYVDETGQRGGGEIYRDRRPMIVAAGERLPFKDKAFDFVYTNHVIEHAEDLPAMLEEMSRVGRAGFIECPNPLLERVLDQEQHNWYVALVDGELLITEKRDDTNIARREDAFYFRMMSDHFIIRKYWECFVTRYSWTDRIRFRRVDSVRAMMDAQPIDEAVLNDVPARRSSILMAALRDSVREDAVDMVKKSPAGDFLRSASRKVRKFRRQQKAPRVSEAKLLELLGCPHCHGELRRASRSYECSSCDRAYPDSDEVAVLL